MNAVVYRGPGEVQLEEVAQPCPADDGLLVKVHCCAICGTDLKLATIGHHRCHPPRVIGHEMVGSVVHVGRDVSGFTPGERITLATTVSCGACPYCAADLSNICPNAEPISFDHDGAFAQLVAIPPLAIAGGNVLKVPDNVPDEAAALAEPLSCAINAQQIAGVKQADTVLVIGGGPLGALHVELAKALGAARVMISQRSEPRLSMLRALRGVRVIDAIDEEVAAIVQEETDGLGADVVIVCAPSREAQEQAIAYARKGGTVSLFASLPREEADITLDSRAIHYGELRIVGASDSRPEHVQRALDILSRGLIDVGSIVTHRLPLECIHQGLQLMAEKRSLKVMMYPDASRMPEAAASEDATQ